MITNLGTVHVGAPPPRQPTDWGLAHVHFNGFGGLTTTRDEFVRSPKFSCFGHQWTVELYPGGDDESDDGYVALFLYNMTAEAIEVELKLIVKHPNGEKDISIANGELLKFLPRGSDVIDGIGSAKACLNFALRSTLLNYLVDGTLIVEVHMRTNKPGQLSSPFVPENPFLQNAMVDFGNEDTADVKLGVGGAVESALEKGNLIKTPTTTFHVHHYALRLNAPALADMCRPNDDDSAPITINNVEPAIFKHLLYYCYGGKINKEDLGSDAKDIIEAADRFGIVNLKLEAEACYVDTVELTLDNFIEVVTYADSMNLALLKEHCMDFLSCADKVEAAEKVSFDDMPSRLVKDLLVAQARSDKKSDKGDKFSTMRVSELRRLAHEKGLSVDGSREMLIASLKDDGDVEDSVAE